MGSTRTAIAAAAGSGRAGAFIRHEEPPPVSGLSPAHRLFIHVIRAAVFTRPFDRVAFAEELRHLAESAG